jgi:PPM family protein phosphatase
VRRSWGYGTDQRLRKENQDTHGVFEFPGFTLAVVCDGMGGHAGGAQASAIGVRTVHDFIESNLSRHISEVLPEAILVANDTIHATAVEHSRLTGMGTTIVAAAITDDHVAYMAHVGDSRIYQIRGDDSAQVTRDHTMVNLFVDAELISEEEAKRHPDAHVLARSLGVEQGVEVEVQEPLELDDGDTLLLCSDGVHGVVSGDEMADLDWMLPHEATRQLLSTIASRNGDDNATIVAVTLAEPSEEVAPMEPPDVEARLAAALAPKTPQPRDPRATPVPVQRTDEPSTEELLKGIPPQRELRQTLTLIGGGAVGGVVAAIVVLFGMIYMKSSPPPPPPVAKAAPPAVPAPVLPEVNHGGVQSARAENFFAPNLDPVPQRLPRQPEKYAGPVPPGPVEEAVIASATQGACTKALKDALAATADNSVYGPLVGFAWRCFDLTYQDPLTTIIIDTPAHFPRAELLLSGRPVPEVGQAAPAGLEFRLDAWMNDDNLLSDVVYDLFGEAAVNASLSRDIELEALAANSFRKSWDDPAFDERLVPYWQRRVELLRRVRKSPLASRLSATATAKLSAELELDNSAPPSLQR